jgi:predicted Zn-dependent protease
VRWTAGELLESALRAARRAKYLDVALTSVRSVKAIGDEGSEEVVESGQEHLTVRALTVGYATASSSSVSAESAAALAESAERSSLAAERAVRLAPVDSSSGERRSAKDRAGMEEALAVLRELGSALGKIGAGRRRLSFEQISVRRSIATSEGSEVDEETMVNMLTVELALPNGLRVRRALGIQGPVGGGLVDAVAESVADEVRVASREPASLSPLYRGSRFTVIMDHEAAGALAEAVAGATSSAALMYSLAASSRVAVLDEPRLPGAPGSRVWDDEGVSTRPKTLLSPGGFSRLGTRLTASSGSEAGNAYGLPGSPRPGHSNVHVRAGDWSSEEIWDEAGEAFLLRGAEGLELDEHGVLTLRPRAAYLRRRDGDLIPLRGLTVRDRLDWLLSHVRGASKDVFIAPELADGVPRGRGGPLLLIDSARLS